MKIIIEATSKEIAALVLELQERQIEENMEHGLQGNGKQYVSKEDGLLLCTGTEQ